ncbi:hypothetical protein R1flu_022844 [Riccia fluitans]|uniref:Methyltransferase n=1 Tax=Riccia fluitans TaxID=41844 RepID=A0ABD1XQC6_9MARC
MKSKSVRVPEKRIPGVLMTAVIFISMFLIAIWIVSAPSDTSSGYVSAVGDSTSNIKPGNEQALAEEKADAQDKIDDEEVEEDKPPKNDVDPKASEEEQQTEKVEQGIEQQEEGEPEMKKDGEIPNEKDEATDEEGLPVNTEAEEKETDGEKLELSVENKEANKSSLITQAKESTEEKISEVIEKEGTVDEKALETKKDDTQSSDGAATEDRVEVTDDGKYIWKVCTFEGAQDYIPCLDNKKEIKKLPSTKHFEHRERHCPVGEDLPTCLAPLPEGYKIRIDWPESRDKIWHANVPHDKLVSYKQDQNWVRKEGDMLVFPGGGTQFKHGALQYIDSIHNILDDISWGKKSRVILDVGCGVASFGGYMFDRDGLVMSFAPKDEHDAQVQMALERGIPALVSVMGTKRLSFPSNVYDIVHCARCRVKWHAEGGRLLLELNRLLRPGGYFVWSATPVYRQDPEDVDDWKETIKVTEAMCWKMVIRTKADPETQIGYAIFQKPEDNTCYEKRTVDQPPMCEVDDKQDAAWYVDMNSCLHRIPTGEEARGTEWPVEWPARVETTPKWLKTVPKGLYGKPAADEFVADSEHWRHVIEKSYLTKVGITWSHVRNVLDMKAGYGGFAAALASQPLWVMNVIPTDEPDTLPIIFDRGLIGLYHDWCESLSTYPRTYDLMHSSHLFSGLKKRCPNGIVDTIIEMDRVLRPNGWAIFRETADVMGEIEEMMKSLHWEVKYTYGEKSERLVAAQKGMWRPESVL